MTLPHRVRLTLIPTVSAACGYSPTERTRRPHRVRKSATVMTATAM